MPKLISSKLITPTHIPKSLLSTIHCHPSSGEYTSQESKKPTTAPFEARLVLIHPCQSLSLQNSLPPHTFQKVYYLPFTAIHHQESIQAKNLKSQLWHHSKPAWFLSIHAKAYLFKTHYPHTHSKKFIIYHSLPSIIRRVYKPRI